MEIVIEYASLEDAQRLVHVQDLSFYDDYIAYGECPSYQESIEAMRDHIISKIVYKVLLGSTIIGDAIVRKLDNNKYYLRVISIIPTYQGKGIGQKVYKFIESDIKDAKEWELITPQKNSRNHHFYEKLGFQKTGEYNHNNILVLYIYNKKINI